jgi:hypothetical protein
MSKDKHSKKKPAKPTPKTKKKRMPIPAPIPTNSLDSPTLLTGQRHFAEVKPVSDGPWTANDSDKYFNSKYYKAEGVTSVPPLRTPDYVVKLADIIGQDAVTAIASVNKTVFHAVGDTGPTKQANYDDDELPVAEMMANDVEDPTVDNRAAFFFHLGDVIYEFGEDELFYYEQFYEPYRNYNAPIFAIPGNHDGMIHTAGAQPLEPFLYNFCAPAPGPSKDAQGLIRDTMTQPGVYFTLDSPLVSIIGLYSNILDSWPNGLISNYQNKYPKINNVQLEFLESELQRLSTLPADQKGAIIIAVHHPLFGEGAKGGSPMLLDDLDNICTKTGVWPDAVLSGHAHNYQRWTRNVNGREIPCVTAGCGGYNIKPISPPPPNDTTSPVALNGHELRYYAGAIGYLKISVTKQKLGIAYNSPASTYGVGADTVVVDLVAHKIIKEGKGDSDGLV